VIGSSVLVAAFALAVFIFVTIADNRVQPPGIRDPADDPIHVHGLGVNPADNSLLLATHTGLFRVPDGEQAARRVSESRQDTVGFTVVGPNRFLGSGHPDVREMRERNLPPRLGLIESTDAGETWVALSLLGEADFHVLDRAESRIYGFDATNRRLLVSRKDGTSWRTHALPGRKPVIDLAVDPDDAQHVVAATEAGLYASGNEGQDWTLRSRAVGLLDWPRSDHLYLVSQAGAVRVSADAGATWREIGALRSEPAALFARSATEVYVALHDGSVKLSTDGGASWVDAVSSQA
jgi:hypothetical protein